MDNQKYFTFFIILALIFVLAVKLLTASKDPTHPITLNGKTLHVETVDTEEKRQLGLMNREIMPENNGMLFVFDKEAIYPFWMKNTKIPLDIIWISKDLKVVELTTMQPCLKIPCPSYAPKNTALYVVEANAGWAAKNGVQIGSDVVLEKKQGKLIQLLMLDFYPKLRIPVIKH